MAFIRTGLDAIIAFYSIGRFWDIGPVWSFYTMIVSHGLGYWVLVLPLSLFTA
ncbi:MAG: hypothetical protein KF829_03335 [Ferruginibacter sp.]|nr:hypothetical protein [Ferruginibacter sp.]